MTSRYRWVVLAVGAFGAATYAMLRMGLPSLGPALREQLDLSLAEVGVAFSVLALGGTITLIPWGVLTDRIGERPVMVVGMALFAGALVATAFAPGYVALLVALALAGGMGSASTGASGRAIMTWFPRSERGTALGIRQMALPIGGAAGAVLLPRLVGLGGLEAAMLTLGGLAVAASLAAALWMRDPPAGASGPPTVVTADAPAPYSDPRQWRLGAASGLLVVGQSAMLGFIVLFLHDARGLSPAAAAAGLAVIQILGAAARLLAGRRSDMEGMRIPLLRRIAAVDAALLAATAALAGAPGFVLYPILLAAGVTAMCWNGLAFTAAAEIAGRRRAGTAMGIQNSVVSVGSTVAPAAFGALVQAAGWSVGYAAAAAGPLVALALLAPLQRDEARRVRERARRLAAAGATA
jgi:sugar phosphate permease